MTTEPTALSEPPGHADDVPSGDPRSMLVRLGLSPWDALVLVAIGLAVVLFVPPMFLESWTPRMALVLAIGPLGLAALATAARRGDLPSRLLLAALAWTVVVAAIGPAPRSALLGFAGRDLSALTVTLSAGLWSLGRLVGPRGARAAVELLVWAAALSALVGISQVVADVDSGPLALAFGRPTGFVTNPVYFGAVSAAGLVACIAAWDDVSRRRYVAPLLVLGMAASLSGSRVALLAAGVAIAAHALVKRDRSSAFASGLGVVALALGVALDRVAGAGRNAADRLATGSGGGRSTVWGYAFDAFGDRPLLGYGFGRFRPAVQGRFSADFVAEHSIDDVTQAWFDAHNVGIGVLLAVGIVGAALFVGWATSWVRVARGPLLWALLPVALHWLLQPLSLFTLPLAMLVFGVAGASGARIDPPGRRSTAGTAAVGVALAAMLVVGDLAFQRAADDLDADGMATIASVLGDDPVLGDVVAQAYELTATSAADAADELDWRRRVAESEPDRPFWWSRLAEEQLEVGLVDEADRSIRRALDLQPNNVRSIRIETLLALRTEDEDRLEDALDRACAIGSSDCDIDAATLIEEFRAATDDADG